MARVFEIHQILGCDWSPDNSSLTIQIKPVKGANFGLRLPALHVDFLATFLANMQYDATLEDPEGGQTIGETASIIPEIVKNVAGGAGDYKGRHYRMLKVGLENGLRRFLAFDAEQFEELKRQLGAAESADRPPTAH